MSIKGAFVKLNHGYNAYSQNNISVQSPEKLILMLYEGALKFASQAKISINANNIEKKTHWINKTSAIYFELINSLEYKAGDVAYYLEGIYQRQIQLLILANIKNEISYIDEVIHVTRQLLESWQENVMDKIHEKMA